MNQKKTKLLLLFLAGMGISGLQAQDAATASGGDASGAGGSAAYSVGQVAYTSIETASGSVNQGVQQPYKVSAIGINTNPDIDLLMSVYPNPTVALINLSIQNMDLSNLSYQSKSYERAYFCYYGRVCCWKLFFEGYREKC
jgi:hypothetical protein